MNINRLFEQGLGLVNNGFQFGTKELNAFVDGAYWDDFDYNQQKFQMYQMMELSNQHTYNIIEFMGRPLMLQKLESCNYVNGCLVTERREVLRPDIAYGKCSWCHDDLISSAYEHTINYGKDGVLSLTPDGVKRFTMMTEEIIRNFQLSVRANLTVGQFHDASGYAFSADTTIEERTLFGNTTSATAGWLTVLKNAAASDTTNKGHLDRAEADVTAWDDADLTAAGYGGDVVALLDELYNKAPAKLAKILNKGPRNVRGRRVAPYVALSTVFYNQMINNYNSVADAVATNDRKITVDKDGENHTYYYRGRIPIVHLEEADAFSDFTKGTVNYIGFNTSGNIQFGGNFSAVKNGGVTGMSPGLIIQRDSSIHSDTYGQWGMLSHVLLKAAIADTDLSTGMISYSEAGTII